MRLQRALITVAGVGALALGLAACGGDGGGTGSELSWEDSPLNTYMSAGYGTDMSEEEMQAESERQQKEVEELVAACMSEEGFEYTPFVQTGMGYSISTEEDEEIYNPDSEKFVSLYGYGAIKGPWDSQPAPDPSEMPVDPNQEYAESLSASEQTAYYAALHGPQPTEEDMAAMEDGTYEWDWTKSGCYGAAQNEVYPQQSSNFQEEFKPLMGEIDEFYTTLWEGSAYDELNGEWSACMTEGGHSGFKRQEDAAQSIYDKVNKYWEENSGAEVDPEAPELEAIWTEEVALATVDLQCREETDYRDEQMRVQFALEQQFVDDHKADLEAYKLAAEQQNSKG